MPPSLRPGRPLAWAAALCLAALLAPPPSARAAELTDLMGPMDKAFAELVKSLLVLTAQKNDPAPALAEAARQAARIAEVARQIPGSGAFPGDQAFMRLAGLAEQLARQVEEEAKGERLAGALGTMVKLHGTCTQCHSEFRF